MVFRTLTVVVAVAVAVGFTGSSMAQETVAPAAGDSPDSPASTSSPSASAGENPVAGSKEDFFAVKERTETEERAGHIWRRMFLARGRRLRAAQGR